MKILSVSRSSGRSCSEGSCFATGSPGTPATSRSATASTSRGCKPTSPMSSTTRAPSRTPGRCSSSATMGPRMDAIHRCAPGRVRRLTCVTAADAYLGMNNYDGLDIGAFYPVQKDWTPAIVRSPATWRRSTAARCPVRSRSPEPGSRRPSTRRRRAASHS